MKKTQIIIGIGLRKKKNQKVIKRIATIAIDIDIFVKPDLTVRQGHDIADQVEAEILHHLENAEVITVHVEPA